LQDTFDGFINGVILVISADFLEGLQIDNFGFWVYGFGLFKYGESSLSSSDNARSE